MKGNILIFID